MKVTFDEYRAILDDKIKRAMDTRPIMKKIAGDMETKVAFRFRQGKDPNGNPWPKLADSTLENRRKKGKGAKPLRDEGDLALSISSKITRFSAVTGSDRPYAAYQQFPVKKGDSGKKKVTEKVRSHKRRTRKGGKTTVKEHKRTRKVATPWGDKPGRPFLGFSNNQKIKYKRWVKNFIQKGEE